MAKDNNLQDFLTDIADAIREKKGTTQKINPQDFATEIANLSGGNTEETSNIEYLDISGVSDSRLKVALVYNCIYLKGFIESYDAYVTGTPYIQYNNLNGDIDDVSQIAIALKDEMIMSMGGTIQSGPLEQNVKQNANVPKEQLDAIPRITKEEFYSLEQQPSELDA